ncbi:hypothetical protein M1403_03440 [Patescibacteria group bacterium]|nr:hypothetical protein [Patescibacteria group bacterium]
MNSFKNHELIRLYPDAISVRKVSGLKMFFREHREAIGNTALAGCLILGFLAGEGMLHVSVENNALLTGFPELKTLAPIVLGLMAGAFTGGSIRQAIIKKDS